VLLTQFTLVLFATAAAAFMGSWFGASSRPGPVESGSEEEPPRIAIRDQVRRVLAVIAVLLMFIGLGADRLGLSTNPGIGIKQVFVCVVATAIFAVTAFIDSKPPDPPASSD
jgi:Na+/H+ antiporter NhaD/arsenite permease-like protein